MFLKRKIRNLTVTVITILSAILVMTLGGTSASAATTAHSAATAVEAPAVPDTVSSCTYGLSSGNIYMCFGIIGSNTYVNAMWTSVHVLHLGRYLHFEIIGPSFPKGLNCPTDQNVYVPAGTIYSCAWGFNTDLDAGPYSGITWRWLGGNSYTKVAQITWDVRS